MSRLVKPWLASFDWEIVTEINRGLCRQKGALHKPTTDGHLPALILAFSPGRRNSYWPFLILRLIIRQIPLHAFSRKWQMILPLLGERAGVSAGNQFYFNFSASSSPSAVASAMGCFPSVRCAGP